MASLIDTDIKKVAIKLLNPMTTWYNLTEGSAYASISPL